MHDDVHPQRAPHPFERGHVLGKKYRLIAHLGEGGAGTVYEAENNWTKRRVALKVLRKELSRDDQAVKRFLQEGRSTTMVAHPNIVEVLDMDQDDQDGSVFIVQEFLIGTSLWICCGKKVVSQSKKP